MKLILASTSPRRKEILATTHLEFEIQPTEYEEDMTLDLDPVSLAKHLSLGKAQSIAHKYPDALIISADTFVVFEDKKLGKPKSAEDAQAMLAILSGKTHSVITGLTLINTATKKIHSHIEETKVHFKDFNDQEIADYVATGEPFGKAGSYAIQGIGKKLVERIEGDYHNVMGMPLNSLMRILKEEFNIH